MSCENCVKGNVLSGTPEGQMVGDAYFHGASADATEGSSKNAIILLTDIFGLPLVNSKLIADRLSKETGCDVWVPDIFAGSPPVTVDELEPLVPRRPGESMTWASKLKFFWLLLTHIGGLVSNRPSVSDARATEFVAKLKTEKQYEKVGAIGYCWGGAMGIRLGSKGLFDTVLIAHPGNCTIAQIEAINIPAAWACAEDDTAFGPELRNKAEAVFEARRGKPEFLDFEFKDYKGTVHGFAARPALEIPESVAGFEGALEQSIAWFKKYLA